jgi:hypothetical protein
MTLLDLLLEILSLIPGYPLKSVPTRGEGRGWILGVIVLAGAVTLGLLQDFRRVP